MSRYPASATASRNKIIVWLLAMLAALGVVVTVVSGGPTPVPAASTSPSATVQASVPAPSTVAPSVGPTGSVSANEWGPFAQVGIQHRAEPDPALTPGAINPAVTQATITTTICVSGYTATIRPPQSYTGPLKVKQIAQYGYTDTATTSYEEDHLIALEDGGAPSDPFNLWPEPKVSTLADGTSVGFPTKDHFENYVHAAICSGRMPLAEGQKELATDWVSGWLAAGKP